MIGERIADYQLTNVIGHGAQAIVYAADDVKLGREVALKVFLPQLTREPARVQRYFEEARAIAALGHAGIVRVFEWGHDEHGRVFVAMERLRGETLYERLRRGPLSIGEAVTILRDLATALHVAHSSVDEEGTAAPIVHRDLKPENVFLADAPDGARVVLMDFGLARLAGSPTNAVTWSGAGAFGTPPYMSPEQCRDDGGLDHRTDLYALGCLLHEMVTGTPPFGFRSAAELVRAHCDEPAPALADGAVDVPPGLDTLAAELLGKRPQDRPPDCRAVIARLDALDVATPLSSRGERRAPLPTLVHPVRHGRTTRAARVWRRVLELPPWTVSGAALVVGATLLGLSTVVGVGDSYLRSPNWSVVYVLLVPLIVSFMIKVVQRLDAAVRDMVSRGMIEPRESVAATMLRFGGWQAIVLACIAVFAIGLSIGEWLHRYNDAPIRGAWWAESAVVGALGAVCQGLLIAAILGFCLHGLAWIQQLHGWTASRARLRLRSDTSEPDERAGFASLEDPFELAVVVALLVQLSLYLSNVMHVAEQRGESFLAIANPFADGGVFDFGTGRYPGSMPVIASVMVAGFLIAWFYLLRRVLDAAGANASPARRPEWPMLRLPLPLVVVIVALPCIAVVWFRLAPAVVLILGILALRVRAT